MMRKPIRLLGLGLIPMAMTAQAAISNPGGAGFLDTIASTFNGATLGWMTTAQGYAQHIFAGLAVLDLAWWGIKNVLKKNDLADFIGGATLKISSIFFFYTIVSYAPTWMPLITASFMTMGQTIGGAAAVTTPSGVMSEAFSVIATLWTVVDSNMSWTHPASSMLFSLIAVSTSLLGLIGFGLVALQLFATQIEMYLVGGAGLVMLGFTGSSLTSSFGEKYIGYMVSVGIKLLVIFAIVGLGQQVISNEISYINGLGTPGANGNVAINPLDLLSVGVTMLIYGVIGMQVPGMAGSLMNGSPNMSLGNVAGGAAAIAGGAALAGAAAAAGVGGAAASLGKMADLAGAGVGGGPGGMGGIGGDSLAAMSSMTGPSGMSGTTSIPPGGSADVAAAPSAPSSGTADALEAGGTDASSSTSAGSVGQDTAKTSASPWNTMGNTLDALANKKDDIARHEGSSGSGIQIRLNHAE